MEFNQIKPPFKVVMTAKEKNEWRGKYPFVDKYLMFTIIGKKTVGAALLIEILEDEDKYDKWWSADYFKLSINCPVYLRNIR